MDRIWRETLARLDKLELQVRNIENHIVPGVNEKEEPDQTPDQTPDQNLDQEPEPKPE